MTRTWTRLIAAAFFGMTWLALEPNTTPRAQAAPPVLEITAAAPGYYDDDDFWEDRFNAMRKIWGTPYVPLGYYWNSVRGLPNYPAPVAPGLIADRPLYRGYGGYGTGYGYSSFYGPRYGYYGYNSYYSPRYGYNSYYGPSFGSRYYPGYGSFSRFGGYRGYGYPYYGGNRGGLFLRFGPFSGFGIRW